MAERLHIDTSDEIIYRARKLRQRHDELVIQCEAGSWSFKQRTWTRSTPMFAPSARNCRKSMPMQMKIICHCPSKYF